MIVRFELDTTKAEDREILARIFGDAAPVNGAPMRENAATDELVQGRDALRRLVVVWKTRGPPALEIDLSSWPYLVGYAVACQGLLPAVMAVWDESAEGISAEAYTQRELLAGDFVRNLVKLAESAGLDDLQPWRLT